LRAVALLATPLAALPAAGADAAAMRPLTAQPNFYEIPWPFRIDQWGTGRAFRCESARCGAQIEVYLRAKAGFCNCATGVADDDEIDRVGDTALLEGNATALAPGQAVTAGFLPGRLRPFRIGSRFAAEKFVVEIARHNKCDAVVATAVAPVPIDGRGQRAVLAFLGGTEVQRWAAANTGSEVQ
jgi:hypothetical protein